MVPARAAATAGATPGLSRPARHGRGAGPLGVGARPGLQRRQAPWRAAGRAGPGRTGCQAWRRRRPRLRRRAGALALRRGRPLGGQPLQRRLRAQRQAEADLRALRRVSRPTGGRSVRYGPGPAACQHPAGCQSWHSLACVAGTGEVNRGRQPGAPAVRRSCWGARAAARRPRCRRARWPRRRSRPPRCAGAPGRAPARARRAPGAPMTSGPAWPRSTEARERMCGTARPRTRCFSRRLGAEGQAITCRLHMIASSAWPGLQVRCSPGAAPPAAHTRPLSTA